MYSLALKLRPKDFSLTRFKEKFNELKMRSFVPKYPFSISNKDYLIKTADTLEEICEVHRLRREIFAMDFGITDQNFGIDFSRYDMLADHIIVVNKANNKIISTYRLISSLVSREFYSQTEYEIDSLIITRENKVELSRACVHPSYRSGSAIAMIWRGLGEYVAMTDSRYLFGLSSRHCQDSHVAAKMGDMIPNKHRGQDFDIYVKRKFRTPVDFSELVADVDDLELPSLLQSYLNAGAKIYGAPAFDKDFNSVDFFTLIDTQKMEPKYFERYFKR